MNCNRDINSFLSANLNNKTGEKLMFLRYLYSKLMNLSNLKGAQMHNMICIKDRGLYSIIDIV